jgi:hypothetical protein
MSSLLFLCDEMLLYVLALIDLMSPLLLLYVETFVSVLHPCSECCHVKDGIVQTIRARMCASSEEILLSGAAIS